LAGPLSPGILSSLWRWAIGERGPLWKDAQQKTASLRPGKDTEPEMIIDRILGPGLTVIGCELASYRHAFMRQMAMATATGQKFLDTFNVKKCKTLYNAGGLSEYMIFKNLMDFPAHALDLHKKWERLDKDCIGQLDSYFDKHRGLGAVFLGEYSLIKRRLPNNRDNLLAAHELTMQREFEDINDITDWSIGKKISVIVSHKLSTRGSLHYGGAITNRDNELKIVKRRGQWILEMVRSSKHFPTYHDIEQITGLPHSTAHGRLKSLAKRDRIVKIKDKPIRWMVNPNISSLSMSNMVDK
jgi:hypothetical protein